MAATFVVETGTGSTTANSYSTVAAADQYFENYRNPTAWTSLDNDGKEMALRMGTQFLDARYSGRWRGDKANETQRLDWPRCSAYVDGFRVDEEEMPSELADATAEAALRYAEDGELIPDIDNPGSVIRERFDADGPHVDTTYAGPGQSQIVWYRKVDLMVRKLVFGEGEIIRG